MIELFFSFLAGAVVAGWYCYKWGFSDGREDGYSAGQADAVQDDGRASPQGGGGTKPVIR